jgi:hypothetical protein
MFYKINGNSTNVALKNFLDTYKPPSIVNDYNLLRIEARKLGYDEKQGRKREQLINYLISKSRDKAILVLQELQSNKINELIRNKNYQGVLDMVIRGRVLSETQYNALWNNLIGEKYIIRLEVAVAEDNSFYKSFPINAVTYEFFHSIFTNGFIETKEAGFGSDAMDSIILSAVIDMKIEKMQKSKKVLQKDGAYFAYINTSTIDLSRYQIYTQEQANNISKFSDHHCLLECLVLSGVEDVLVNQIKLSYVSGANIRKKDLPEICDIIGRNIHVYTLDNNGKIRVQKVGKGEHTIGLGSISQSRNVSASSPIKICLYENHYFLFEDSIYSSFFIKNYEVLCDVENPFLIRAVKMVGNVNYYERTGTAINTLSLVYMMMNKQMFQKLDLSMFEEATNKTNDIYLDNIENEQELFVDEIEEDEDGRVDIGNRENLKNFMDRTKMIGSGVAECNDETSIYYADSETHVNNINHSLFLLGCVGSSNDCVNIWKVNDETQPQDVVNSFLNYMTKGKPIKDHKIICYFHNLKYDYHILEPYLNMTGKVMKDNQVYSVKIRHYNYKIEFRDSYKLFPQGLGKFKKVFNLSDEFGKKEAIAYTYYTPENYGERVDVGIYRKFLKEDDKDTFDTNMFTECSFDKKTKTFDPLSYYIEYLRLDCLTLKKGLEKFNTLILEITGDISIFHCLTISSLTDKYMIKNGAYDGVYSVQGNLREYISRAVYGGRVAVNEKYKKKVIEGKVADYDGVSLYPSAINRLCREIGLPTGEAKRVRKGNNSIDYQYAILTVKIKSVNKTQQIPFIAHKGDGVINYLNEPPPEPIIIDIITLQDYVKFHKIEYEILDGVYWEGNFNKKMGELVQKLFNERLKYKKSNPALAETIKLMLNSSYGKTIMKKANTEVKIIKNQSKKGNKTAKPEPKAKTNNYEPSVLSVDDVFQTYVYNNFRTIKSYRKVNEYNYEVERLKVDDSNNRGHIGCAILSMSKRIMNEIFDIANDKGFPIYYTDTDSLHCNCDDVKPLEDEYKRIYGKELNGKNLEQFHTDFSLDGVGKDKDGNDYEIYATKSIFLGKKSYLDCLESKDVNGNKITGFHIRLKGITVEGLNNEASKYDNSFTGMYEAFANGEELNILLNPKDKVLFEYKKGFVATKGDFYRKVKF